LVGPRCAKQMTPQIEKNDPAKGKTFPTEVDDRRLGREVVWRRVIAGSLALFLFAGLLGFFGVRKATVAASAGGYELTVDYGKISRPALSTPWTIQIVKPGGFGDKPVKIATTLAYFRLFDANGLNPEPSATTSSGKDLIWEFDPPPGDILRIEFDARIDPKEQGGTDAVTSILDDQDKPIVSVKYRTRLMP